MYNPKKIEKKWQKIWKKEGIYKLKNKVKNKKNFYHLAMFPYPSGDLHIGHWYNFAPADVYARLKKMQGYNVMSPMGFDSFGLPAENAAIKRKIHPKDWTYKNIKIMTKQLESMGNMYDWSRRVITSDSEYYKWTQWMFIQLYKNGLAYKKNAAANWCPKCHTVLANEQVVDGKCERCGTKVVQREIEQWLFRITKYADRLLKDLDKIDWPEKTKLMQKNWIGKSQGAEIEFKIKNKELRIKVFTTRLDTIFGCTYVVVAPEHPIITDYRLLITNYGKVAEYVENAKHKLERERLIEDKQKTGMELKGIKAINPATNEEIPVFVSDYILGHYGTGAIMAVPAYDERDLEFAEKFNLPIIKAPLIPKDEIIKKLGAKKTVNYKLRDWLVSRQRYWGAPIPIVYCDKCGQVAVPEKDLPVLLPKVKNYLPTEKGLSPLARSKEFVNVKCPKCNSSAKRETDTMDTFVCSSWYYLRYADPKNKNKFADVKKLKAWLPVKMYIGGTEHAVLHLLYSRFFTKTLKDFGYLDFDEPFLSLRHQGIILGPDGQKMSKSRGNVIDPDDLIKKFGSDTVRMYLCFMGEYSQGGPWNPTGIMGVKRFLERVWKLNAKSEIQNSKQIKNPKLENLIHKTIKKVAEDIENFRFNTAISALMILLNEIEKQKNIPLILYSKFLILLSPFAPHLAEELWQELKATSEKRQATSKFKSIFEESWPKYDSRLIKEEKFELVIQINGKIRDKVLAETGIAQKEAEKIVLKREKIKELIAGRAVKKIIFVPNRLINIIF